MWANGRDGRPALPPLWVRHLERLPLNTRYFEVVARVKELLNTPPLRDKRVALLVDRTGVGQGAVDELLRERLRPIAVFAHGGDKTTQDKEGLKTPKKDLIHTAQMLLESGRLKVAPGLREAPTLKKELARRSSQTTRSSRTRRPPMNRSPPGARETTTTSSSRSLLPDGSASGGTRISTSTTPGGTSVRRTSS